MIRFGIHVNPRGQPQVSLPIYKVGEDGVPMDVPAGTEFYNVEDLANEDPAVLEKLKEEIEDMSMRQNSKRQRTDSGKGAGGWDQPKKSWGGNQSKGSWGSDRQGAAWGGDQGSWNGYANGDGWGSEEVTLFVSGVPPGVPRRELLHVFRQYAGFQSLRQKDNEDHCLVFVSFATQEQAQFVAQALTGYIFDEEVPPDQQTALSLAPAKTKLRK